MAMIIPGRCFLVVGNFDGGLLVDMLGFASFVGMDAGNFQDHP
jgi:hypothetical protein